MAKARRPRKPSVEQIVQLVIGAELPVTDSEDESGTYAKRTIV
jgi:hypothetical protein